MDLTAVFFNELGAWTDLSRTLLRIGLILVIAWVMLALSRRVIPMLRKQLQKHTHDPEQHKRLETLGRVLRYIAAVVITLYTPSARNPTTRRKRTSCDAPPGCVARFLFRCIAP